MCVYVCVGASPYIYLQPSEDLAVPQQHVTILVSHRLPSNAVGAAP